MILKTVYVNCYFLCLWVCALTFKYVRAFWILNKVIKKFMLTGTSNVDKIDQFKTSNEQKKRKKW